MLYVFGTTYISTPIRGLLWPSGKACAASVLTLYSNQCAIREQQVLLWSIYPWQMAAQVILTNGLQLKELNREDCFHRPTSDEC